MFCHKCGKQNEEIARFCCACGTQLKSAVISVNTRQKVALISCGKNKLSVIKEIRILKGLGLKEALDLADQAPVILKTNVDQEEAQKIKHTCESVGAIVEIS